MYGTLSRQFTITFTSGGVSPWHSINFVTLDAVTANIHRLKYQNTSSYVAYYGCQPKQRRGVQYVYLPYILILFSH